MSEHDDRKYLELDMTPVGGEPIKVVEAVEAFSLQDGFLVLLEWDEGLERMVPFRGYSMRVVERFEVHDQPPSINPVQAGSVDTFESLQSGSATGGFFRFDPDAGLQAA